LLSYFIVNILEKQMQRLIDQKIQDHANILTGGYPPTKQILKNIRQLFRANWDVPFFFLDRQKLAEEACQRYMIPETMMVNFVY
jgi:hypothetical protein